MAQRMHDAGVIQALSGERFALELIGQIRGITQARREHVDGQRGIGNGVATQVYAGRGPCP
jgi:hypothetical protein